MVGSLERWSLASRAAVGTVGVEVGIWYCYPEQIEGPPEYVSDVEVAADDVVDAPSPPQKPKRAFYYSPGDLKGVPYDTIEECTKVIQQAGDVGVCVYK
jgi:hypothetical protein